MNNDFRNVKDEYKKQSIITSTREELTLSLYNGCIRFINDAVSCLEAKDMENANYQIQKAENIINELICTLDMALEISFNMKRLYEYILDKLIDGNIKKDPILLKEAADLVKEFRNVWYEAMKSVREGNNVNAG